MYSSISNWLSDLLVSMPKEIFMSLMFSFFWFIIMQCVRKTKMINKSVSKFLCNVLNSKIEISEKTRIIDSPEYLEYLQNDSENMNTVDRNNNAKEVSDFLILLFFSFLFFSLYIDLITIFLKWIGIIPLLISILILFIVSFSREIQKVSIRFIFYSIPISISTLYYSISITQNISINNISILNPQDITNVFYVFVGFLFGVAPSILSYILLLRSIMIYIDRKVPNNSSKLIRNFIAKTNKYESDFRLLVTVGVSIILSYVFSSGVLLDFIRLQTR